MGERSDGQSSEYIYNAMGVRIANTQVRVNKNAGYASSELIGFSGVDYSRFLRDGMVISHMNMTPRILQRERPTPMTTTQASTIATISPALYLH
ncbi:MAG: hypothetical protein FWG88_11005 [Oscillospiraceae bacterium]|nr:hypothetical protein [Oscillospiraceae bacterium]